MRVLSVLAVVAAVLAGTSTNVVLGAGGEAFTDPAKAGPDFAVQGEYEGTIGGKRAGLQVIALGDGKFDVVDYRGGLPGAGWDGKAPAKLKGESQNGVTVITGPSWQAKIKDGVVSGTVGLVNVEAKKVTRKSPTLGARPPAGAIVLFDGSSVDAWKNGKLVAEGDHKYLGVGVRTNEEFGNFKLHLEFRTPYMPKSRGQGRGNSGMYLADQYECQILDSFGLDGKDNECGGIYKVSRPDVNMCLPPLSWQTYDVDFSGAKFDAEGKKTSDAVVTIKHNGVVIHGDRKLPAPTPGGGRRDEKPGSLFLQNHSNPVVFRNIWIVKK